MTETMTKNDFAEAVKAGVADRMGEDYEVTFQSVMKNNGTGKMGIIVRQIDDDIAPTIYIDGHCRETDEGIEADIDAAVDAVVSTYKHSRPGVSIDTAGLHDYARARERICFRLINAGKNTERLESLPYVMFQDLAVVFFIPVDLEKDGDASAIVQVTIRMMESWGVTTDDLLKAALENTPALYPAKFRLLGDMFGEMAGGTVEMSGSGPQVYVVTNDKCVNGAAVALYPGFLKSMSEKMGGNFYILPSSIHELLLIPDDGNADSQELRGMVAEVNATTVSAEEFLSDNIYRFSGKKESVSIV